MSKPVKPLLVGLLLMGSFVSALELPKDEDRMSTKNEKILVAYDSELYDLAYQTFLVNQNLKPAFYVAQKAVEENPASIRWRRRYAEVSAWIGSSDISMEQWMILLKATKNPKDIENAIKVAQLTFNYPALIKLYQYQLDHGIPMKAVVGGLSAALEDQGEAEKALALLQKYKSPTDEKIIKLQLELGQLAPALKNLQSEQRKNGISLDNSMQQAEVLFMMGRVKQAYQVLKETIPYAKPGDKRYWLLLSELSWKEGEKPLALMAYQRLYDLKDKDQSLLYRLSFLLQEINPKRSLEIALENWKRYPTVAHLYQAVYLSFSQENDLLFYYLFNLLPQKEKYKHADLYIDWALRKNRNELAFDAAEKAEQAGSQLPDWLKLSLAMRANDAAEIKKYLMAVELSSDEESYGDLSNAADQIGDIKKAQEFAYKALEKKPNDESAYRNFRDVMLPHSNSIDVRVEVRQNGPVSGFEEAIDTRYFISPGLYIEPFLKWWNTHSNDKARIQDVPKGLNDFGAFLGYQRRQSVYLAQINEHQAVRNYRQAEFVWQEQWGRLFRSRITGGWQKNADESTQLLVGGKKNFVDAGLTYQVAPRDSFSAAFVANEYYSQDQVYLGAGENYRLSWFHQFNFDYPDWNMNTYASVNQYKNSNRPSGIMNNLLPFASTGGALPLNFFELGMTIGVGQVYREEYTHAFRPFAQGGFFWHSVNGLGEMLTAGIAGSVFGRDHLAFYGTFSRNAQTALQIDYSVGLEYRLYY